MKNLRKREKHTDSWEKKDTKFRERERGRDWEIDR